MNKGVVSETDHPFRFSNQHVDRTFVSVGRDIARALANGDGAEVVSLSAFPGHRVPVRGWT